MWRSTKMPRFFSSFTTRQDGPVWKTKIFPKFQIGAVAHPRVTMDFLWKWKNFLKVSCWDCQSLYFPFQFLPLPHPALPPSPLLPVQIIICICTPCPYGTELDCSVTSDFGFELSCEKWYFWDKWVREESVYRKYGWDDSYHLEYDYVNAAN